MDFKLVICKDESPISIPNVEWIKIPGDAQEFAGIVSDAECRNLPTSNYTIVKRYRHVTKLNVTSYFGKSCLEVCYQRQEGFPIESEIL